MNDFDPSIRRIGTDGQQHYLLAFYPSGPASRRQFRRPQVEVSRPHVHVQARRGYVAVEGR